MVWQVGVLILFICESATAVERVRREIIQQTHGTCTPTFLSLPPRITKTTFLVPHSLHSLQKNKTTNPGKAGDGEEVGFLFTYLPLPGRERVQNRTFWIWKGTVDAGIRCIEPFLSLICSTLPTTFGSQYGWDSEQNL